MDDSEDTLLLSEEDRQIDPALAAYGGKLGRQELEARLLSKLDGRMSILILIYILNYIDRNNASAARLHGFERDLNLTGNQFASVLSILYVGYLVMQIPSETLKISPGLHGDMGRDLCFDWACHQASLKRHFSPGAWFLISKWYTRRELSQRTALLSCGSLISNAFGSLIASGILDSMEGRLGYAAWRWLFFIEGGATVAVAILAMFILPDFPENSSNWLSPAEQSLAMRRMAEDAGMDDDPDSKHKSTTGLFMALSDWKVWWLALTLTSIVMSLSFNAFFPTLAETMGHGRTLNALALRTSVVLCYLCWFCHIQVTLLLSSVCLLMLFARHVNDEYDSPLYLTSYAGFITYLSWASGTIRPAHKRAVALAFINMVSSLGNIAGSFIWPAAWAPRYATSYSICIFASTLGILMCFMFRQYLVFLNAQAERREAEMDEPRGYRYLL
ncbi:MFS general substrate transporter [Mycena venus]|uniref:MFS general substrate transporter n=1 Tax=Mycena venus TaxID=2733690 RepID=A0A8H6Y603_9AGAR|nr:MFS general substrate transporter [Mycena venus]